MYIVDRDYCCQGEALTLSEDRCLRLMDFIDKHFCQIKSINYKSSSYGLKHIVEKRVGFYVSNADLKKAMTECDFRSDRKTDYRNWFFNVSEKSVKKVMEMELVPWEPMES